MNKLVILTTAFLFSTLLVFSLGSIFEYKIMVYQSTVTYQGKKCIVTLKLYPVNSDSIQLNIEIDNKSHCKSSVLTNLRYRGIDSSSKVIFIVGQKPSNSILLRNYDGFEVLISTDKFKQARIKVPKSEISKYVPENLILKKIFSE